jgi:hypothetical protein
MNRERGHEVADIGFAKAIGRQIQGRFALNLIVVSERVIGCRCFSTAC